MNTSHAHSVETSEISHGVKRTCPVRALNGSGRGQGQEEKGSKKTIMQFNEWKF